MATRLPPPEPPAAETMKAAAAPPEPPAPAPELKTPPVEAVLAALPPTQERPIEVELRPAAAFAVGWEQDLFIEAAATLAARMKRHGAVLTREEALEAVVSARTLVEVAREEV